MRGFSLTELLVALLATAILMIGVIGAFRTQVQASSHQELLVSREQSLRMALGLIEPELRRAGASAPRANQPGNPVTWFHWVTGFNANPRIWVGAQGAPDRLAVAGIGDCTADDPLTTLDQAANRGATTLTLVSTDDVDTNARSVLLIGDAEHVKVRNVNGNTVTIDTVVYLSGNQGLRYRYPAGTTVCRVDVRTYGIETANGETYLYQNLNQGAGREPLADGVTNLKATINGGRINVTLTGQTPERDPVTGGFPSRRLVASANLRNR